VLGWAAINSGLTDTNVEALAISANGRLFGGTASGVFRSVESILPVKDGDAEGLRKFTPDAHSMARIT
jgi:hypothetical protein